MTLARTTIAALFVAIAGMFTATVDAASYHSIDSKAVRLQNKASQLYAEVNAHYRHAAHYGHMRSDASQMYFLARDIHLLAHRSYGIDRMQYKLDKLDSLFHHFEELVEHIEHDALHGGGHVHGHTGHVKGLLASMENTLHNLRAEVKALQHDLHFHGGHVGHGHGGHGGHHGGHGGHGGGVISFGGGAFKIRIGH